MKIAFLTLDLSNTFNELLYESIITVCNNNNIDLVTIDGGRLASKDNNEYQKNFIYNHLKKEKFDGVIVSNIFDYVSEYEAISFLKRFDNIPVVTISKKVDSFSCVSVDNRIGMVDLVMHLINGGVTKFAIVGGPENNSDSIERINACKEVFKKNNIDFDDKYIYYGHFNYYDGQDAVKYFFDEIEYFPQAIISINDNMAFGVIDELNKRGLMIPKDIKVAGFDNTIESYFTTPPLSTVYYPMNRLGEEAVWMVIKKINNLDVDDVVLSTHFIPRQSTGFEDFFIPLRLRLLPKYEKIENLINYNIVSLKNEEINILEKTFDFIQKNSDDEEKIVEYVKSVFFNRDNFYILPVLLDYLNYFITFQKKDNILLKGLLLKLSYNYSNFHFREVNNERKLYDEILKFGEELLTSYDRLKILYKILDKKEIIKTDFLVFVKYEDVHCNYSKINGYIKDDKVFFIESPVFLSERILNENLEKEFRDYLVIPLYNNEDKLGYFLMSNNYGIGLISKSIRHLLSSFMKTSQLMETINFYSMHIEKRIDEKTEELIMKNKMLEEEIERKKKLENYIINVKKYEALGILTESISRDLNNYLTGIITYLSILKSMNNNKELEYYIDNIFNILSKMENYIKNIIDLEDNIVIDDENLENAIKLLLEKLLTGTNITYEIENRQNVNLMSNHRNNIIRVINSIVLFFIMSYHIDKKNSDNLKIVCDKSMVYQKDNLYLTDGEYYTISISNKNCFLTDYYMERIFDPYFIVINNNNSLSNSYKKIVQQKGTILVKSDINEGTEFKVFLPVN